MNKTNKKEETPQIKEIYADIFYVVSNARTGIRIISPLLDSYVTDDPDVKVEEVYQAMTPEGNIFEFPKRFEETANAVIIEDPISNVAYKVILK